MAQTTNIPEVSEPESHEEKRDRLSERLQLYDLILKDEPNNVDILLKKGFALNQLGQYAKAVPVLEEAFHESKRLNVKVCMQLALAYSQTEKYQDALWLYRLVIANESENAEAMNCLGFTLGLMGRHEEAIEYYNKAIEIDKNYTDAYLNLGYSLDALGNHKRAIDEYDKIISINPRDCCAYLNKGCSFSEMGQYKKAIAEFSKAIALRPDDACSHLNKGYALYRCCNYDEALKEINEAINLDNKYDDAYYLRAAVLEAKGMFLEAIAEYTRTLQYFPSNLNLYYARAELYYLLQRFEEAFADYQILLITKNIELTTPDIIKIAQCQYELKKYNGAFEILEPLFNSFEQNDTSVEDFLVVTKLMGDCLYSQGEKEKAKVYYRLWRNSMFKLERICSEYQTKVLRKKFSPYEKEIARRIFFG